MHQASKRLPADYPGGADPLSIHTLQHEEASELDTFLALHSHSSMHLRAELRREGDRTNFAVARRQGRIVAAAVQAAGGMMVLQAPVAGGALAAAILKTTRQRLAGFFGPWEQVQAARHDMGLDGVPMLKDTREDLFALALSELRAPPVLRASGVRCRVAGEDDFELLLAWRSSFLQAAMGDSPGELLEKKSRADIAALLPAGSLFILEAREPVACCSFNARLPDMVQIGNVWTPPNLRGNGYGRAVVAGALSIARASGVVAAVLATGRQNAAAQAAYRGIGFELIGDYSTTMISREIELPEF